MKFLFIAAAAVASNIVRIPGQGSVRGGRNGSCSFYLGMPYAEPPVGIRRWTDPAPKSSWEPAVRDASSHGPTCPQHGGWPTLLSMWQDEDCLQLNIFKHENRNVSTRIGELPLLPVMIWIHGGSYTWGGAHDTETDGCRFVESSPEIIVVTIQYRLGIFGGLGGDLVEERQKKQLREAPSTNFALKDQIMALQWVREHITVFGGDRNKVTIVGESAGAGSVSALLVSPPARGLFHRAVMQSGAFAPWATKTVNDAQNILNDVMSIANCTALECLISMSTEQLLMIQSRVRAYEDSWLTCRWAPTVDHKILPAAPYDIIMSQNISSIADVPIIVGSNQEEGSWFASQSRSSSSNLLKHDMSWGELNKWLSSNFPPSSIEKQLRQTYIDSRNALSSFATLHGAWGVAQQIVGDLSYVCPARRGLQVLSQGRAMGTRLSKVYAFIFRATPPSSFNSDASYGACHGCEIPFIFNGSSISGHRETMHLSRVMRIYYRTFIINGSFQSLLSDYYIKDDEEDENLVPWPAYDFPAASSWHLSFNLHHPSAVVETGYRDVACDTWNRIRDFTLILSSDKHNDGKEKKQLFFTSEPIGIIVVVIGITTTFGIITGTCCWCRRRYSSSNRWRNNYTREDLKFIDGKEDSAGYKEEDDEIEMNVLDDDDHHGDEDSSGVTAAAEMCFQELSTREEDDDDDDDGDDDDDAKTGEHNLQAEMDAKTNLDDGNDDEEEEDRKR